MSLVWYEKDADKNDSIIFQHRLFSSDGEREHLHHFHCGIEMVFVVKGDCEAFIDNEKYVLHSGDMCYIEGIRTHKFCYSKGNECYVVVLSPGDVNLNNGLGTLSFDTVNPYNAGFDVIKKFGLLI